MLTQTVIPLAQWIGLSSCAVNPVVYCLFSAKFRDGFRQLLVAERCCWTPSAATGHRRVSAGVTNGHRRVSAGVTTGRLVSTLVHNTTAGRPQVSVALEMREVAACLADRAMH